jgi:hypothetical protein
MFESLFAHRSGGDRGWGHPGSLRSPSSAFLRFVQSGLAL